MIDFVGFGVVTAMKAQFSKNSGEKYYESKLISVMQEDNRTGMLSASFLKVTDNHFLAPLLGQKLTNGNGY